jgi:hypothetical protein
MGDYGNKRAPDGHVYVCGACGKVSRWRYGFDLAEKNDSSPGWDESCSMNCGLGTEADITEPKGWTYPQRVTAIKTLEADHG